MERETIKAISRPAVIKQVCFGIFAGAVMVASKDFLFAHLATYLSVADRAEALFRFRVVMAGLALMLLPPIVYCGILAYRIAALRQFPLPGAMVWRDTPVVRGRPALVRAAILVLLVIFMLGVAIYVQFIPVHLASHVS